MGGSHRPSGLFSVIGELYSFSHDIRRRIILNRIALVGSFAAALGFFFLPLIELKPNRIASGIPFNLLELQGDYRYMLLFILTLVRWRWLSAKMSFLVAGCWRWWAISYSS
jgi:H+/Cl- antiporter ClcA